MKVLFKFVFWSILCLSVFPDSFECVFIDGYADQLIDGNWIPVDFGTEIQTDGVLLLDSGSSIQLQSGTSSLFFTQPGEYRLTEVAGKVPSEQSFTGLGRKISSLVSEQDPRTTSTVMGIRGDEVEVPDDLGFESTDEEEIALAWEKIEAGDFASAEEDLEFLYTMSADPFSEGQLLFSLAYVEEMQGKTGEAWMHLGDIIMPERGEYYESYLLLSGKLSMKSRNFEEAKISFETFIRQFPRSEAIEEAKLMLELSKQ